MGDVSSFYTMALTASTVRDCMPKHIRCFSARKKSRRWCAQTSEVTKQAKLLYCHYTKGGMSSTCCSAWKVLSFFHCYSSYCFFLLIIFFILLAVMLPLLSLDRCFVTITTFMSGSFYFVYPSTCLRNIILFHWQNNEPPSTECYDAVSATPPGPPGRFFEPPVEYNCASALLFRGLAPSSLFSWENGKDGNQAMN